MMHAVGFALAGMAGMSLGLMGGGGSLLTVPILVYGFQLSAILSSSYSLAIVGATTLIGAVSALRQGQIHLPSAAGFLAASLPGAFLTRKFVLHALPDTIWFGSAFGVPRENVLMAAFGILMIMAALLTVNHRDQDSRAAQILPSNPLLLGAMGFGVGALTGLLGAGGGFLIVPVLALMARLPMRIAIGTSMAIVSANAWISLAGDLGRQPDWNWNFVIVFTSISAAGMLLGRAIGGKLDARKLNSVAVWTTFTVGLFILIREISQGVPWY